MTYVVDLGSTKASCLVARWTNAGELEVLGTGEGRSAGIDRGEICDPKAAGAVIREVVQQASDQAGVPLPGEITIGFGGFQLESLNAQGYVPLYPRGRAIAREDVLQVVNHSRQIKTDPGREQVLAVPREFVVDDERGISDPLGMKGGRLEVVTHIVIGESAAIQATEQAVGQAGFRCSQMVPIALASGLAVSSPNERELGCVTIDIGAETTSVAIFQGGAIAFTAVLPIGSRYVSSDLSKLLKTTQEEGERLKTHYGVALARESEGLSSVSVMQIGQVEPRHLDRRVLCEIIESRMRELASMVKDQIEETGLLGLLPGGAILTGGGSRLSKTPELFDLVLKTLQVRLGKPRVRGPQSIAASSGQWAGAVGLATYALTEANNDLQAAGEIEGWRDRVRNFKALFGARA